MRHNLLIHYEKQEISEVIKCYEYLVKQYSEWTDLLITEAIGYRYIAEAYAVLEEWIKAVSCFKQGLKAKSNALLHIAYAHYLYGQGNYSSALSHLAKGLRHKRQEKISYTAITRVLCEAGIQTITEKGEVSFYTDELAYYLQIGCYYHLSQKAEAQAALSALNQKYPGSSLISLTAAQWKLENITGEKSSPPLTNFFSRRSSNNLVVTLPDNLLSVLPASNLGVSTDALQIGREIGQGRYGSVRQGRWGEAEVAIRTLYPRELFPRVLAEFKQEASRNMKLQSPFVVRLYSVTLQHPYCMVMEYMKGGSLYNALHRPDASMDWKKRTKIAIEIAAGLQFLHEKDIIHGDIRSMKVLLDNKGHAKLGDFGFAKVKEESSKLMRVDASSLFWLAPELMLGESITKASDIYSLGMVLWELASGRIPFYDSPYPAVVLRRVATEGMQETIPEHTPPWYSDIIHRCWQFNPATRPNIEEVLALLKLGLQSFKTASTEQASAPVARVSTNMILPTPIFSKDEHDKLFPNPEDKEQWFKATDFMSRYMSLSASQRDESRLEFEGWQYYFRMVKDSINQLKAPKTITEELFEKMNNYLNLVLEKEPEVQLSPRPGRR